MCYIFKNVLYDKTRSTIYKLYVAQLDYVLHFKKTLPITKHVLLLLYNVCEYSSYPFKNLKQAFLYWASYAEFINQEGDSRILVIIVDDWKTYQHHMWGGRVLKHTLVTHMQSMPKSKKV